MRIASGGIGDDGPAEAPRPHLHRHVSVVPVAEAQLAISGIQVARAIYDTLTAPDENGDIQPLLAESVEPNDDFTQWTLVAREGLELHLPLTRELPD